MIGVLSENLVEILLAMISDTKKLTGIGSDGVAVGLVVIVGSNDGGIVTVG